LKESNVIYASEATENSPANTLQTEISERVVLVDDSSAVRQATRMLLKTVGLELLPYHSPAQYLQDLPEAGCILLDVRMPEMSGIELYRRLREAGVETPVIFMTGHGQVAMAVSAMREGAFDFLEKPVDDQRLIDTIFAAIARDTERREAAALKERISGKVARLTARERRIADLVAEGLSSREVAEKLDLSVRTVEVHRARVFEKMNVRSAVELANLVRSLG